MNSPELLLLVENCPKGAETLVTRCLHILTDKGKTHILVPSRQMRTNHEPDLLLNENMHAHKCCKRLRPIKQASVAISASISRAGGESERPLPQTGA